MLKAIKFFLEFSSIVFLLVNLYTVESFKSCYVKDSQCVESYGLFKLDEASTLNNGKYEWWYDMDTYPVYLSIESNGINEKTSFLLAADNKIRIAFLSLGDQKYIVDKMNVVEVGPGDVTALTIEKKILSLLITPIYLRFKKRDIELKSGDLAVTFLAYKTTEETLPLQKVVPTNLYLATNVFRYDYSKGVKLPDGEAYTCLIYIIQIEKNLLKFALVDQDIYNYEMILQDDGTIINKTSILSKEFTNRQRIDLLQFIELSEKVVVLSKTEIAFVKDDESLVFSGIMMKKIEPDLTEKENLSIAFALQQIDKGLVKVCSSTAPGTYVYVCYKIIYDPLKDFVFNAKREIMSGQQLLGGTDKDLDSYMKYLHKFSYSIEEKKLYLSTETETNILNYVDLDTSKIDQTHVSIYKLQPFVYTNAEGSQFFCDPNLKSLASAQFIVKIIEPNLAVVFFLSDLDPFFLWYQFNSVSGDIQNIFGYEKLISKVPYEFKNTPTEEDHCLQKAQDALKYAHKFYINGATVHIVTNVSPQQMSFKAQDEPVLYESLNYYASIAEEFELSTKYTPKLYVEKFDPNKSTFILRYTDPFKIYDYPISLSTAGTIVKIAPLKVVYESSQKQYFVSDEELKIHQMIKDATDVTYNADQKLIEIKNNDHSLKIYLKEGYTASAYAKLHPTLYQHKTYNCLFSAYTYKGIFHKDFLKEWHDVTLPLDEGTLDDVFKIQIYKSDVGIYVITLYYSQKEVVYYIKYAENDGWVTGIKQEITLTSNERPAIYDYFASQLDYLLSQVQQISHEEDGKIQFLAEDGKTRLVVVADIEPVEDERQMNYMTDHIVPPELFAKAQGAEKMKYKRLLLDQNNKKDLEFKEKWDPVGSNKKDPVSDKKKKKIAKPIRRRGLLAQSSEEKVLYLLPNSFYWRGQRQDYSKDNDYMVTFKVKSIDEKTIELVIKGLTLEATYIIERFPETGQTLFIQLKQQNLLRSSWEPKVSPYQNVRLPSNFVNYRSEQLLSKQLTGAELDKLAFMELQLQQIIARAAYVKTLSNYGLSLETSGGDSRFTIAYTSSNTYRFMPETSFIDGAFQNLYSGTYMETKYPIELVLVKNSLGSIMYTVYGYDAHYFTLQYQEKDGWVTSQRYLGTVELKSQEAVDRATVKAEYKMIDVLSTLNQVAFEKDGTLQLICNNGKSRFGFKLMSPQVNALSNSNIQQSPGWSKKYIVPDTFFLEGFKQYYTLPEPYSAFIEINKPANGVLNVQFSGILQILIEYKYQENDGWILSSRRLGIKQLLQDSKITPDMVDSERSIIGILSDAHQIAFENDGSVQFISSYGKHRITFK